MTIRTLAAASSALALLAGCTVNTEQDNNVAEADQVNAAMDNQMANQPPNPYSDAVMRMHDRMMAASGSTPGETYIRKMIEHHRGAIDLANIAAVESEDPQVRLLAEQSRAEHMREIEQLERLLTGAAGVETATPDGAAPGAIPRTTRPPAASETQTNRAASRPTNRAASEPASNADDEHAGHDMNDM